MYSILRSKNEGLKSHALEFARQLVDTPSPSFAEERAAALVEARMHAIGYDKVFRDEAGNVVGVLFGREAAPTVLLNCHMDTALPAEGPRAAAGTGSPERPGWIAGAGAADCKGGLAAQVFAGALLKRSLLPLRGNVVVAATVAEENGRSVGVRTLLQRTLPELGLQPAYAILGEPTDMGLYYGHDGWMEFNIVVKGPNPFQVNDAVSAIFNDLKTYQGSPSGDSLQDVERSAIQWPRFRDDEDGRSAIIAMARRLSVDESPATVLSSIHHHARLAAHPGSAVAVEVMLAEEIRKLYTGESTTVSHVTNAWTTDPFHPLISRARQALAAADCPVRPGRWRLGRLGMATAGVRPHPGVPGAGRGLRPGKRGSRAHHRRAGRRSAHRRGRLRHRVDRSQPRGDSGGRLDVGRNLIRRRETAMNVLVFNCGSSSLKYRLIAMPADEEVGRRRGAAGRPAHGRARRSSSTATGPARNARVADAGPRIRLRAGDAAAGDATRGWCRTWWGIAWCTAGDRFAQPARVDRRGAGRPGVVQPDLRRFTTRRRSR